MKSLKVPVQRNLVKRIFVFLLASFSTLLYYSCSEKHFFEMFEGDNVSHLPEYSDIVFTVDSVGEHGTRTIVLSEPLRSGTLVTAKAIQIKKGKLLNETEYTWSVNGECVKQYIVPYDQQPFDPYCQFEVPKKFATFSIKFHAKFKPSTPRCTCPKNNNDITYSCSQLEGHANVLRLISTK